MANFDADADVLGDANDIDDYANDESSVELPSSLFDNSTPTYQSEDGSDFTSKDADTIRSSNRTRAANGVKCVLLARRFRHSMDCSDVAGSNPGWLSQLYCNNSTYSYDDKRYNYR